MHVRCPHCHSPIELVEAAAPGEVLCPSCGSSFRLGPPATTAWSPEAGRTLGRFELLGVVGTGAFGTVYKARDPALDRVVALKVPRAGNLPGGAELDRFLREARSAAQLRHPAIVPVHEAGQEGGVPYLVSDFVAGVTLADWLTARRPTPREAAGLVARVADALQYAHERGVVHRDVKPSNVLLDAAGRPHLTDFGLARREAGEVTMSLDGQVLGTPAYMPPEQARGEARRVDGRSDVYSLGVVLYELLAGGLPFRGNARMLLHQVLHDDPRPPRALDDRVPRDLETVCLKCLEKEPGRRYQTARELADDLGRWLRGEPVRARPASPWTRAVKWAKQHPAGAALMAVVGAAVAAVLTVGLMYDARLHRALGLAAERQAEADRANEAVEAVQAQVEAEKHETSAARDRARAHLYFLGIERAHTAWAADDLATAGQALAECPEPLRRWEWHYLRRLCNSQLASFAAGTGRASAIALSADGRHVALAGLDGNQVRVADVGGGRPTRRFPVGFTDPVYCLAFSPDGRHLAAGGGHFHQVQQRYMTDVAGLRITAPLPARDQQGLVTVWDAASGEKLRTWSGPEGPVTAVAFSPDGRRVAAAVGDPNLAGRWRAAAKGVTVWDVGTGREVAAFRGPGLATAVAFSPDGTRLAAAYVGGLSPLPVAGELDRLSGLVKVWEVAGGREVSSWRQGGGGTVGLAFRPDGGALAAAGFVAGMEGDVTLLDPATGRKGLTLRGHARNVLHVAFSRDGRRLATAGGENAVRVWDAATGREVLALRGRRADALAFTPDGRRLLTADKDGRVLTWDAADRPEYRTVRAHGMPVNGLAFSPDGRRFATAGQDGTAKVWDAAGGHLLRTLFWGFAAPVAGVAFSPDGVYLATCTGWESPGEIAGPTTYADDRAREEGTRPRAEWVVKVWEAATGRVVASWRGHRGNVLAVAYSPDGRLLASAGADRTVRLWDVAAGKAVRVLGGHRGTVRGIAFSPDGRRLAAAGDYYDAAAKQVRGELKLWGVADGKELPAVQGDVGIAHCVCFSPDGRRLATGFEDARLWDTATGRLVRTFPDRAGITSMAFSPDGRRLVTASADQVHVWDADGGHKALTLRAGLGPGFAVAVTSDGHHIASAGFDGEVRIWDGTPFEAARSAAGDAATR